MDELVCPHCGSNNYYGHGSYNGNPRYFCRSCKKTFPTVDEPGYKTKILLDREQIIAFHQEGISLSKIGEMAGGLSRQRIHQILNS